MTFAEFLQYFFKWAYDLIENIPIALAWLVAPLPSLSTIVGFNVSPLGLLGVGALLIGVVRAIIGQIID